jgi:hydroxyacylglutathione hydrolase
MDFVFEQIRTGGDRNFAYLVGDREAGVAVAVDPSYQPRLTYDRATAQGLKITTVLATHGHVDHINGHAEMLELTGAVNAAHPDSPARPNLPLADGDALGVGRFKIEVMHVPGHCPDHVLFYLPEVAVAITGDHLFVGKIGGTSGEAAARAEWDSLGRMLEKLPDETTIWPGHDYGCRPSSTIALEKRTNPFLLTKDFEEFLALKANWAEFKGAQGLA